MEQGTIAKVLLDAVNGSVVSTTKTTVFSCCRIVSYGELAQEQRHIDHHFINSRGRDLSGLHCALLSARWVIRDIGTDVIRSNYSNVITNNGKQLPHSFSLYSD